jgi:hypothetical protein
MTTPTPTTIQRLAALILLLTTTAAQAQTVTKRPATQPTTKPQSQASPAYTELERDPVRIESIGLTINLPVGSTAETIRIGESTSTAVVLPAQLGTIVIKEQRTLSEELEAKEAVDSIKNQLTKTLGYEIIAEQPDLRVGIWSGSRFYAKSTRQKDPAAYRGISVFQLKAQTFLIFDLTVEGDEQRFADARALYETSIATMDLEEMSNETLKRAAGFKATESLIASIEFEDYDAVLTGRNGERWERLYTPAKTGEQMDATEHGYRRVRSWAGYRGELTNKDKSDWNDTDRQLGYLVQIDALALEQAMRIESRSIFFMSLDATEEAWTIRMAIKRDAATQNSTITGARTGSKLTITTTSGQGAPNVTRPYIPEDGYLTQVQSYLMGPFLVHKDLSGEFASYAYNSASGAVSIRWDIAQRDKDNPDTWRITTKTSPESPATTAVYDKEGKVKRVELGIGRIWEPIPLKDLLDLWKRKGLPLD